jgi:hypothetical protein
VVLAKSTKKKAHRSIILNGVRTDYFDIYEDWLYHNSISNPSDLRSRSHTSLASTLGQSIGLLPPKCKGENLSQEEARKNYANVLGCYSLGTILHDTPFLDALASKFIRTLQQSHAHQSQLIRLLTAEAMHSIIESYSITSPLYVLLVSAYARFASAREIELLAYSEYDARFKSAVMVRLGLLRGKQHVDGAAAEDFVIGECRFHGHGFYEACSVRKRC